MAAISGSESGVSGSEGLVVFEDLAEGLAVGVAEVVVPFGGVGSSMDILLGGADRVLALGAEGGFEERVLVADVVGLRSGERTRVLVPLVRCGDRERERERVLCLSERVGGSSLFVSVLCCSLLGRCGMANLPLRDLCLSRLLLLSLSRLSLPSRPLSPFLCRPLSRSRDRLRSLLFSGRSRE